MFKEEKELWVKFACAAIAGSMSTLDERVSKWNKEVASSHPEDMIDEEDIIKDDCSFAAQYADRMVALFYDKFKDC